MMEADNAVSQNNPSIFDLLLADKSAVGAINRPLQPVQDEFVDVHNQWNPVWGTSIGAIMNFNE